MSAPFDSLFHALLLFVVSVVLMGAVSLFGGIALAEGLRMRDLRWTWAGVLLVPATLLCLPAPPLGLVALGVCTVGGVAGLIRQSSDVAAGGDRAKIARERLGVFAGVELLVARWRELNEGVSWLKDDRLTVGRDERGRRVTIPAAGLSGAHTLILGATGSGKTCTEAWIAARLVEHGHGAVVVDPKGDETLREELRSGRADRSWSGRLRDRWRTTPTPMARRARSPTRRSPARRSPSPTT
jgi:hypothetical protein